MKRSVLIVLLLVAVKCLLSQTFLTFTDRLNRLPEAERQAAADSFMNSVRSFPYCETSTTVHFIYRGNVGSVAIAGDATGWKPDVLLKHISGTDMWYYTGTFESDARLEYKFVTDNTNWILDPLNLNTCTGGLGSNSEFSMPGYTSPPELNYHEGIPRGTILDTIFFSKNLGNSRMIKIYLPAAYNENQKLYPSVLFHDGLEYISLCGTDNILDYLVAQKMIAPVIGIFVPPVEREKEYTGAMQEKFRLFITEELIPFLETRYRIDPDPHKRATIGASNGGNIALYLGMKNPEIFGNIGAQSSNVETHISNAFQSSGKMDLSFYLDIGTYDIPELIPLVQNLRIILEKKGYPCQYREIHEGHSWCSWKAHLRLPLMQFFPNEGR